MNPMLHLTMKTAFLLTVASTKHISEIHALDMDPEHLRFNKTDSSVSQDSIRFSGKESNVCVCKALCIFFLLFCSPCLFVHTCKYLRVARKISFVLIVLYS